jgi:hypothetical protein
VRADYLRREFLFVETGVLRSKVIDFTPTKGAVQSNDKGH